MKKYAIHFIYLVVIAILGIFSRSMTSDLEDQLKEQKEIAEKAQMMAEEQRTIAEEQAAMAMKAQKEAEEQIRRAEEALRKCQENE